MRKWTSVTDNLNIAVCKSDADRDVFASCSCIKGRERRLQIKYIMYLYYNYLVVDI